MNWNRRIIIIAIIFLGSVAAYAVEHDIQVLTMGTSVVLVVLLLDAGKPGGL